MTSAPADLTVHLEPPPGWVQIPQEPDAEGTVPLTLAPADWREGWGVRPSIVVELGAPVSGSIRAVATRTAATFLEAGHRIVSWDLWHDHQGRRLLVTYPAGTALVAAMTWVRLEGDRPLSVTATVDADRYLRVMPLLVQAVDTLRVEGTDPTDDAPPEPVEEPPDDDFWSRHGETLEDLSRLQQAQPWAADGFPLSRAAFAAVATAGPRRRGGPRVKDRSSVEELRRAGLVDASGRLTEDGRAAHAALAGADRRIRVESAAAGVPGIFEAARHGETALIWATDPPSRWAGGPARVRDAPALAPGTLQWIPIMRLPEELAAWLQVGPAWPMATRPRRLPRELVTERAEDDRVPPPPDADDHLRSAWAEPWSTWVLTSDTGHAMAGVRAGRHGHFRLVDPHGQDDVVDLQAFPSESLFATLAGVSLL